MLFAANSDPFLWYVTRAMAVMAYSTLALVVMAGQIRVIIRRFGDPIPWVLDEIHAFLSILAVIFVGGHLISLALDPFLPFTVQNLLIPGDQPYRPLAVNIGVFALYALAVVSLSSWVRRFFPYAFWRSLHHLTIVVFALTTVHGLLAGSDSEEPFMRAIYLAASFSIAGLLVARFVVQAPYVAAPTQRR
jgi:predicted ferric reductase